MKTLTYDSLEEGTPLPGRRVAIALFACALLGSGSRSAQAMDATLHHRISDLERSIIANKEEQIELIKGVIRELAFFPLWLIGAQYFELIEIIAMCKHPVDAIMMWRDIQRVGWLGRAITIQIGFLHTLSPREKMRFLSSPRYVELQRELDRLSGKMVSKRPMTHGTQHSCRAVRTHPAVR